MENPVTKFENTIADFFGAPYAVATDCCTHALELSLRLEQQQGNNQAECSKYTYVSVPNMLNMIGMEWNFVDKRWKDWYSITSKTIDAAVFWKRNSYIPKTRMCLSFQQNKHLSTIRGGLILLDSKEDADLLRMMSYDGRTRDQENWWDQSIDVVGYHYYLAPKLAEIGLQNFEKVKDAPVKQKHWDWYRDVSTHPIFKEK